MNWLEKTTLTDLLHISTVFLIAGVGWLIGKQWKQDIRLQILEDTTIRTSQYQKDYEQVITRLTRLEEGVVHMQQDISEIKDILKQIQKGKQS